MDSGLRYFLEVARSGSIRGASERLNVAASAISRHVQILEAEFGAPFLQRSVKGVELTAAGETFLQYAKAVEAERNRARQGIDALNGLRRGHIRIASIDGVVAGFLSDLIADFRARHPGITFALRSMGAEAVVETVRDGDADVGIAFHPTSLEGVRTVYRTTDPLCAVVASGHDLARSKQLTLAEALNHPLALPDTSFGIRRLIDAACRARGLRPDIVLETNSIEALRGFARAGAGLTMLPHSASQREAALGTVVALIVDEGELRSASLDVFVHGERLPPLAASTFVSRLRSVLAQRSAP